MTLFFLPYARKIEKKEKKKENIYIEYIQRLYTMPIPQRRPSEQPETFVSRCMADPTMIEEYSEDQRYAICADQVYDSDETFDDYPQEATDNAQRALDYREANGTTCGEATGWARARQLARREPISLRTVKRMAAFKRHQQHKDVPYDEGCGGIMWDAWGGDAGVEWAIGIVSLLTR